MHELVTMFGPIPRLILEIFMDKILPASKHRDDEQHIAANEEGETKGERISEDQEPVAEADIIMTEDGDDGQNEGGDQDGDDGEKRWDLFGEEFSNNHCPEILPLRAQVNEYLEFLEEKMAVLLRAGPTGFVSGQYGPCDSHSLLRLEPRLDPGSPHKHISMVHKLQIMTPYIGHMIGMKGTVRKADEGKALYDWMMLSPKFRTGAGWVFEGRVHWYLHNVCETLVCRDMGTQADWEMNIKHGDKTFSDLESLRTLLRERPGSRNFNRELLNVYIRPDRMNLASIDSLLIAQISGSSGLQAVLFQITLSSHHGIKADGLQTIWKSFPDEIRKNPPVIVFLVPAAQGRQYKRQSIDPPKAPYTSWRQLVCGLADESLWCLPPAASNHTEGSGI